MPNAINSRASTGQKPCINNETHALLSYSQTTFNMLVLGQKMIPPSSLSSPCSVIVQQIGGVPYMFYYAILSLSLTSPCRETDAKAMDVYLLYNAKLRVQ